MFTDLFYRVHINCLNNNIAKVYPNLEKLLKISYVFEKNLLLIGQGMNSKYLSIC